MSLHAIPLGGGGQMSSHANFDGGGGANVQMSVWGGGAYTLINNRD